MYLCLTKHKAMTTWDLYRGINDFKKGYQPRTNIVRDEKGDLFTDYHSILTRWRNHFCQLFNVHGVSDVRQTEIHTVEPLRPEPSACEVAMAIEKLNRHKSPSIDQLPAELIKAGDRTTRSEIHELIYSIWDLEKLPEEWKESITVPVYNKGDKTDCSNYRSISLLPTTHKILPNTLLSRLTPKAEEIIGDHKCGFRCRSSITDHIYCIRQALEKKWEYNEAVHNLFTDFKEVYVSVRREVLYNILSILIEFGIPMKLVRHIKMCLNETNYSPGRQAFV